MDKYEVIIAGGGPAGLTAGLYTSRIGLRSLLVESRMGGGQIMNATMVENYPGFPEGISGAELASLMHQQAVKYGLEIVSAEVTGITPGKPCSVSTTDGNFETVAVIIAAGSEYRKLGIPGEERLLGHGVSYSQPVMVSSFVAGKWLLLVAVIRPLPMLWNSLGMSRRFM